MKKGVLICLIFAFTTNLPAQNSESIALNPPSKDRGKSVMSALWQRKSVRDFDTAKITHQDLSDLLWAANGINRPEEEGLPSLLNAQDIDIYLQ